MIFMIIAQGVPDRHTDKQNYFSNVDLLTLDQEQSPKGLREEVFVQPSFHTIQMIVRDQLCPTHIALLTLVLLSGYVSCFRAHLDPHHSYITPIAQ